MHVCYIESRKKMFGGGQGSWSSEVTIGPNLQSLIAWCMHCHIEYKSLFVDCVSNRSFEVTRGETLKMLSAWYHKVSKFSWLVDGWITLDVYIVGLFILKASLVKWIHRNYNACSKTRNFNSSSAGMEKPPSLLDSLVRGIDCVLLCFGTRLVLFIYTIKLNFCTAKSVLKYLDKCKFVEKINKKFHTVSIYDR